MIVCSCTGVSDRDVAAVVDAGARTLGEVCRRTGAGQECGTCVFAVRKAVAEHLAHDLPARRPVAAAS